MTRIPVTLVLIDLDTPRYFSDGFYVSRSTDAIGLKVFGSRAAGDRDQGVATAQSLTAWSDNHKGSIWTSFLSQN